jgi:HK97 family phage major capsid protein
VQRLADINDQPRAHLGVSNNAPTIILTNASSANPWRRISNVKTTTSNTWNGVNSAGVNAAWLTEGTIITDGTPTVGNIVVTPQKAAAWVELAA